MGEPPFAIGAVSPRGWRRPEQALNRAADQAVRGTRDCRGATVAVWFRGEPVAASSHPALADFVDVQLRHGAGPLLETGEDLVWVGDTATERRWRGLGARAFGFGIRSIVVAHASMRGLRTTCTLYWPVPRAGRDGVELAAERAAAVARRLARTVGEIESESRMRRTVFHLSSAMASRSEIDIAKGMIMHATSCDEDEAFAELVRVSQRSNIKLAELAHRLVNTPTPRRPGPDHLSVMS